MTGEGKIDPASKDNVKQTLLGMAMGIGFGVFHPANPEKGFDKHLRDVGIPEDEVAAIKSFVESQGKGWPKPPPTEPPANPTITPKPRKRPGNSMGRRLRPRHSLRLSIPHLHRRKRGQRHSKGLLPLPNLSRPPAGRTNYRPALARGRNARTPARA